MRTFALMLALILAAPPTGEDPAPESNDTAPTDAAPTDPALPEPASTSPDSSGTAPANADLTQVEAKVDGPTAEELKREAKGLVAAGKLADAIPIYKRAYALAPGDHIIGYEIGMAAWELGDCDKAREYLRHFATYADPEDFRNKRVKAAELLSEIDYRGCTASDSEVNEATSAAALPKAKDRSDAQLAIGAVLTAFGSVGVITGPVLLALWSTGVGATECPLGTKACGDSCLAATTPCGAGSTLAGAGGATGFLVGGSILIPIGLGLMAGGIVLLVRGKQSSRLTATPTGVSIRF